MNLTRSDYEFNNTKICQIMPKQIELNRVLINLYMLLRYGGRRPVTRGRKEVTLDYIVSQLTEHSDMLIGFNDHPDLIKDWVYSDLIDVVFRGNVDKEAVVSPMPLHLNAYKLRNPKHAMDYRASEHLFSLLRAGDPQLIERLKDFLGQGMTGGDIDSYDDETTLDLDTLMIVRMVGTRNLKERVSGRGEELDPPLCKGQAKLMCSDLRRLLTYENVVPRSILIGYIQTTLGLHLGLYLLRLFHQFPGWTRDHQATSACLNCPVDPDTQNSPFSECPYAFQSSEVSKSSELSESGKIPKSQRLQNFLPELLIDMGEDYKSHMAYLSQENCATHYAAMNDYIPAVFTTNQLFRYANSSTGQSQLAQQPQTIAEALQLLANSPSNFDIYFENLIDTILPPHKLAEEKAEVQAIYNMKELSPLERFVQLVALERTKYYRKYLVHQIDSVLMKNKDAGLLRQGKGSRNRRRWYIGSRLLEVLVQIAVLEPVGQTPGANFRSRPILIDQFVEWLKQRYGIVLIPDKPNATIQDYEAFNNNFHFLKERLREIGFYTDLSDAYNTQTIRPRYAIDPK
ncbi:hypothetical protein QUF64_09650 [Anaerolineales bacterium HSG6]|nr:hypothetical protein [Anaerolineales bacterium HSG6]